ncbi:DinB family protein [Cryobacterium sp. HLT2-28]|uniref:DinB family protein n=2 Tax=Microbacteriaceae TaxID=85023 RepID=A0A4V3ICY8_9MICO|nr:MULTISPECIES: DinB family protein [Cryobacterium]TFB98946.1 DinB family protein [Cryobacterium sp. HLT2-28]TFC03862.1 DinB family protein [Cryobacterium mannosilyticum]
MGGMDRIDPTPAADEATTLAQFLDYQRATLLGKAEGLDAAGLSRRLPPSTLTLGGLLKHLALVEEHWIQVRFLGRPEQEPWVSVSWEDDPDWEFRTAAQDDSEALRELYRTACDHSRAAVAGVDLGALSAGVNRAGEHWSLRWILVHLIEETARHNGHADLLREAVDGTVGE